MKANTFFLGLALLLVTSLLAGCATGPHIVCDAPYIRHEMDCCLDNDASGVCDKDEGNLIAASGEPAECPTLDCTKCPATVIERNVTLTETVYVCEESGLEVNDPKDCKDLSMSVNEFEEYAPVKTNEEGTVIEVFSPRPACRESFNSVELHYKLGSSSPAVTVQIKESPADSWHDVYTYEGGALEKYLYGVFCDWKCTSTADFFLRPGKMYLVRLKIDYDDLYGETQYTNEQFVDAREEGDFLTKLC